MNGNPQDIDLDELDNLNDRVYALHLAIIAINHELKDLRAGPALIQLSMDVADQLDAMVNPSKSQGAQS